MNKYDDILSLPHHVSPTRPQMPRADRAAQFAPFAALTGYEEVIDETARVTQQRPELDEARLEELDAALQFLLARKEEVRITFFLEDETKQGGRICTRTGRIVKADAAGRRLVLDDGTSIAFCDVLELA